MWLSSAWLHLPARKPQADVHLLFAFLWEWSSRNFSCSAAEPLTTGLSYGRCHSVTMRIPGAEPARSVGDRGLALAQEIIQGPRPGCSQPGHRYLWGLLLPVVLVWCKYENMGPWLIFPGMAQVPMWNYLALCNSCMKAGLASTVLWIQCLLWHCLHRSKTE